MMKFLLASLLPYLTCSYVFGPPRSFRSRAPSSAAPRATDSTFLRPAAGCWTNMGMTATPSASLSEQLSNLLENLTGASLLQNSSASWRSAIYDAIGAPASADETTVAKTLQDAMSRDDSQFAILMGKGEDFAANFPSDPVDFLEDGTCWIECRLRERGSDELLVTMSIQLKEEENGAWMISSLDWQDFRDAFYPGLSGREWLRAF